MERGIGWWGIAGSAARMLSRGRPARQSRAALADVDQVLSSGTRAGWVPGQLGTIARCSFRTSRGGLGAVAAAGAEGAPAAAVAVRVPRCPRLVRFGGKGPKGAR